MTGEKGAESQDGLRVGFLLVNALFWISSLGLVIYLSYNIGTRPYTTYFLLSNEYVAYFVLANGVATFLAGFVGYCTGIRINRAFIKTFLVLTSLFVVIDVVIVGGFTYNVATSEWDYRSTWLESPNSTVNGIQLELECCGYDGPTDYSSTSTSTTTSTVTWTTTSTTTSTVTPTSDFPSSSGSSGSAADINLHYSCYYEYVTIDTIDYQPYLNGCSGSLTVVANTIALVVLSVSTVIMIIEIVGIVLASRILSRLRKHTEETLIDEEDDTNQTSKLRYQMIRGPLATVKAD